MSKKEMLIIEEKQFKFREWLHKIHNIYLWSAPEEVDSACLKIVK